jgi:hypothetical protein
MAVPALVAAGLLLAWWILGGIQQVLMSWYGWALLAKLALVAVLLGFASWHRWRLTPALAAGAPGAGRRLARSIASEAVVAVLVLYAAAEMVSTTPGDLRGGQPTTAPAQMERRIGALSLLTEPIRAVAAAMVPLYAALSDEQERTADELLAEHLQDMRRRGP